MASIVSEIMATDVEAVSADAPITEAAQRMRDADVGDVIVREGERPVGILTDRDIVTRIIASGKDTNTPVREACSGADLATVAPDTPLDQAAQLMREHAVRRLPVVDNNRVVGIVSIGDLAMERDEQSALADISVAEPNR